MARPKKTGLTYFPFDVDFFSDIKIRKLIRSQGGKAVTVYVLLLCFIYENGYYMRWDKELPFIIWEQTGYDEAYIQEVINSCLTIGLFDSKIFNNNKVLTSQGIQLRFFSVSKRRVIETNYSYLCGVSVTKTGVSVTETRVNEAKTGFSASESTQRKEKESKEDKKEKEENSATGEIFKKIVEVWEKNIGEINSNLAERLSSLVEDYGFSAYEKAVKRAVKLNKRNYPWIQSVTKNISEGDDFGERSSTGSKENGKANASTGKKGNDAYNAELQAIAAKAGGEAI